MKTLKFIIPRTAASITALITALEYEVSLMGDSDIADTKTSDAAGEQDNTNKGNVADINTTASTVVVVAPGEKALGTAGIVEVDSAGVPWDARIHGTSKVTLKRGGEWKLARSVDSALVETVIAELKQTMAATGAPATSEADDTTAAKTAPAPAAKTAPAPAAKTAPAPAANPIYIVEGSGEFTAEQLKASNWTDEQIADLPVKQVETVAATTTGKTFPELMAAITAAGLDEATILAAVTKQNIQALPLLSARPDLVPAVYADLFPS